MKSKVLVAMAVRLSRWYGAAFFVQKYRKSLSKQVTSFRLIYLKGAWSILRSFYFAQLAWQDKLQDLSEGFYVLYNVTRRTNTKHRYKGRFYE